MKIYKTATQADYDALMIELEEKGYKWPSLEKPTHSDNFKKYGKDTYIYDESGVLSFSDGYYFKAYCSNETLIEYKVKGENMIQEVESDLQEAKSSAKKLIEKIDEYLETSKPKFKVGDYVTVDVNGRKIITKIDELTENKAEAHGLWYDESKNIVKQDFWYLSIGNIFNHSTPEEIAEYESALTFHKHGRKPFEVKKGDLIRTPSEKIDLVWYPENYKKEEFLDYGWKLLKTAEEFNEWIGADDE